MTLHSSFSIAIQSETGAVHISGLAVGTEFTLRASGDSGEQVYIAAEFDGKTENGLELIKKNNNGWTYDAGAWIYSNADLILDKNSSNVAALDFTISAAASLEADADGSPKDVKVTSDLTKGYSTIDFSGMSEAHVVNPNGAGNLTHNSDSSLITFGNVTTGDVRKTVRIQGFNSETATFNLPEGSFYLADLDCDTTAYEFVLVNSYWRRTDSGWNYYSGGVNNINEDTKPDLQITTLNLSDKIRIGASENGAPQGITFEGNQVTVNRGIGTINGAASYTDTVVSEVAIPANALLFAEGTAVNASGIHIIGTGNDSVPKFASSTATTTRTAPVKRLINLPTSIVVWITAMSS